MLLLPDRALEARRHACAGPLAPLYDSLEAELRPLLGREPYVPAAKALLSRRGGRCERDGTTLAFDPWSPEVHTCPTCGARFEGELHHRAWVTHYQLWLAERAVHAALFHLLRGTAHHAALARDILGALADRYLHYPNRDNVLGPTRPFFSTYLESIWLLQVSIAADLLSAGGDQATAARTRDRIIEPSRALVAQYDEHSSNRQVWNNAALMASAFVLGRAQDAAAVVDAPSGLCAHLASGLLPDGSWYEGENYHLFALRGLWYGVAMCDAHGLSLPTALDARFQTAFAIPFRTALPDFTMPSRKDSQYAISLRQWRIAELVELGFARRQAPELGAALRRCYDAVGERHDGGRARSTADAERNAQPSRLTRADLGWRALLHALPELPPLPDARPRSALLEGQGLAIFRRDPDAYVALDYGQSGGGHGHPDRLNLVLAVGDHRWLDDLGTGSYVDPSLHWFRSTLAHNAPLVNGESQPLRAGVLDAFEERGALGWIEATFELPGPSHVTLTRTLVVATDYLISVLRWRADGRVVVDLPWHFDGDVDGLAMTAGELHGGDGLEDGFAFARDVTLADVAPGHVVRLRAVHATQRATLDLHASVPTTLFAAAAPGQPAATARRFHLVRAEAREGEMRAVLAWGRPPRTTFTPERTIVEWEGTERHEHMRATDGGWRMDIVAGASRSSIEIDGRRATPVAAPPAQRTSDAIPVRVVATLPEWLTEASAVDRAPLCIRELGREQYRRSEESWEEAGRPGATVAIGATNHQLHIYVVARSQQPLFAPAAGTNPYDNEHADTMAAGVQLYFHSGSWKCGWMLVPERAPRVRTRPIEAQCGSMAVAQWRPLAEGYEMLAVIPMMLVERSEFRMDVLLNETVVGRERRRGQLVLSGAAGEFVYLRGDRQPVDRFLSFVLVP